jgi:PKD domain
MRRIPVSLLALAASLVAPVVARASTPWQPAVRVSPPGEQVGRAFAVALDARGSGLLVAQRAGSGAATTTRLRLPGGRVSAASVLPAASTVVDAVHLAANARGDAVLAWAVFNGTKSRIYAAYRAAGRPFGPSVPLTPFLPIASSAYPAIDARGHAVVAWGQSGAPVEQVVLAERSAAGAWSAPAPVSAATLGYADPGTQTVAGAVAFDARGGLCVTWSEAGAAGASAVMLRCRAPGAAAFGAIATMSRPGDHSYRQYLAVDPAGNALVAWWNDGDSPAADRLTMEWRLRSAAGVVGPIHRAPDAFGSDPAVAARGAGRFDLFWSAGITTVRTRFAEIRAGVPGPAATLGGAAPFADRVVVASDGAARAAAAWVEQPASGRSRIELTVLRPGGPRLTHVVGRPVTAIGVGVAVDGNGDALVTWADAPPPFILVPATRAAAPPLAPSALFVAGYDRAAPVARTLVVPRRAAVGRRVRLRVVPRDVFGPVRATWRFGDGGVGRGLRVRHAWQAAGRYRVTLQLVDRAGNRRRLTRVVAVR